MNENKILVPKKKIAMPQFSFDLQLFARSPYDIMYRGNKRWNGSHGKIWWDGLEIFEVVSFEATVTADRDDVYCGMDKDSKIVSLTGEGTITIRNVINRNFNRLLEAYKAGKDPRSTLIGLIDDPDAVDGQKERISISNVWFNELQIMQFEKASVVEKELSFGFTPSDSVYIETIGA